MMNDEATTITQSRLQQAIDTVAAHLAAEMQPEGWWQGLLSSSALSTATAVSAFSVAVEAERPPDYEKLIADGAGWLAANQNDDGGWGDSIDSPSNLATSLLSIAALTLAERSTGYLARATVQQATAYVNGELDGRKINAALADTYGKDRTFAVPILTNCAFAGMVQWSDIPRLPYALSVLPHSLFRFLRLHVVSYALPALIAIGLLLDDRKKSSPLRRAVRSMTEQGALKKLQEIQPESGGFLEAAPLTSFVAMTLIPQYGTQHPVAAKCLRFLADTVRSDGSWPIDTNLSAWVTSNAIKALVNSEKLDTINNEKTWQWIGDGQYRQVHPYTNSAPGAWAWTHLDGGVPDTDDTCSAILALLELGERDCIAYGIRWLLDLQNADGGWPTFCRGWGKLPFDQSCPDLTAHALRALVQSLRYNLGNAAEMHKAVRAGLQYLKRTQQPDGSWIPLWFGNQYAPKKENRVIGTAFVLLALAEDVGADDSMRVEAVRYLSGVQNADGGWGGAAGLASSIEETALAVACLAEHYDIADAAVLAAGAEYLLGRIECGPWTHATPIGLYFSSLWYSEKLYPVIWSLDALGRLKKIVANENLFAKDANSL